MSISAVSGSPFSAIAAGARAELKAMTLSRALQDAGMLDQTLADGFEQVRSFAHSVTEAGVAAAKAETVGALIDVVG